MAIVNTSQNLTAVSYSAGEIIDIRNGATLTIDSAPATRPGTIQCITSGKCRIINSSTTTPLVLELQNANSNLRFEGNAVLEIEGDHIEIGVSDGTQQIWDFSSLFSGVITDITLVEIETESGSGEYIPWHIVDITPQFRATAFTVTGSSDPERFDGQQEVLFYDSLTRDLRSGDGTNGKLIPNGCRVRIPNILITNQYWQPDVARIFAIRSLGTPTGGDFTIELIDRATNTNLGTTAAISFNAAATTVRDAVRNVIGATSINSSGGPLPTTVVLTLAGSFTNTPIAMIVSSNVTGGTNSVIYVNENAASNMSILDLNPSGTLIAENCAFSSKFRTVNASFSAIEMKSVGVGADAMQFINSNGGVKLDTVSFRSHPGTQHAVCSISNLSSLVSLKKVIITTSLANGNLIQILPELVACDDIRVLAFGSRVSTAAINTLAINTIPNIPIKRPRVVGGSLRLTNLLGNTIFSYAHADTPSTQTTVNPAVACSMINCIDLRFADVKNAGTSSSRSAVFSADAACADILVVSGSYNMNNHGAGIIGQHNGAGFEIRNFELLGSRTNIQSFDAPTSFACTDMNGLKVFVEGGQALTPSIDSNQDGIYDLVSVDFNRIIVANLSVENFVGGNYMDTGTLASPPSTGHVSFHSIGSGPTVELSSSSFTDQIGSVFLPNDGDIVEITTPFPMHGITSFRNLNPRFIGDCPGGFSRVHRIINDGGVTGGTYTLTIFDETDALIGTTAAIAYNANTTAVDTAIELITGAGSVTVSGGLTAGYLITFLTGVVRRILADGTNLTGGDKPGILDAYARYTITEDSEIFPGIEFACRVPSTNWPTYQDLNAANLSGTIASLSGYDAGGAGLEMKLKLTATGDAEFRRLQQCTLFTNIDSSLYDVTDASIKFNGPASTDVVRIRKLSDLGASPPINLFSFTGGGQKNFNVGLEFDEEVFFVREDQEGTVLMRSLPFTLKLNYGDLGEVNLFYGEEVQLAQASELLNLLTLAEAIKNKTDNLPPSPSSEPTTIEAVKAARLAAALSS